MAYINRILAELLSISEINRSMSLKSALAVVVAVASAATCSAATVISYPDFSSVAGLSLNGNAAQSGNTLSLTTANANQDGTAWYNTLVNLVNGFDTTFQYDASGGSGADGISFTIQTQGTNAIGSAGGSLGASGITNSVITAFRTYVYNDVEVDSCGPNVASNVGACVVGSAAATTRGTHTARILYNPGTIQVFLDGNSLFTSAFNLGNAIALSGGTSAFVGFTGATGGANDNQTISSWTLSVPDTGVPEPGTWMLLASSFCVVALRRKLQ